MDGWLCVIIAQQRGMIDERVKQRIFACMSKIGMYMCMYMCLNLFMAYDVCCEYTQRSLLERRGSNVCEKILSSS